MPNSESVSGLSSPSLLPANGETVANQEKKLTLNPLFQPETLEYLTQTILQEIQGQGLTAVLAEFTPLIHAVQDNSPKPAQLSTLRAIKPSLPSGQSPGTAGVNSSPHFYFLEATSQASGVRTSPSPQQTEPQFSYSAPIDPLFAPSVRDQNLSFLDVHSIRRDFPILQERVNGKPLIWFDNAATTQKPQAVIDRLSYFYRHQNSNVH